ncbi:MAG TPA: hypothetical protein VKD91_19275, partial [Pyrinomonadaceae bacterium]|nr:hypothetical protein [Pyrinomonadaceae bacterium]
MAFGVGLAFGGAADGLGALSASFFTESFFASSFFIPAGAALFSSLDFGAALSGFGAVTGDSVAVFAGLALLLVIERG